jgi:ribose/xylose/arabinose/galactoside ABC-type transport system permease subunit
MIITGARMVYTKATPSGTLPTLLRILGQHRIGPVPVAALIFAAVAALAAVVLHRTTFGRRLYATGGNARASRLCGVNTDRIIVLTYVISGLLAGLAGLVLAGYVGYADQWMGRGLELDSIAATVVGGTSFAGGVGGVSGTVAGVLLVSVLSNVLLLLNVNVQLQLVLKGLVIIAAVAAYSYQTRD